MAFPIRPSTSPGTGPLNTGGPGSGNEDDYPDAELSPGAIEVRVEELIATLTRDAERRIGERRPIEQRWIRNTYQYQGQYSEIELKGIRAAGSTHHKSTVYLNETMRNCDDIEDRIVDVEFPVDDRNFSIDPTAVPELSDEAMAWARFAAENQQLLLQAPEGTQLAQEAMAAQQESTRRATEVQAVLDEARRRSTAMQEIMEDQLQETSYNIQCKQMIHDAVLLGTGVMKGPVLASETKQVWTERVDEASGFAVHEMEAKEEPRPAYYRVDVWNWFPSMSACNINESESFFERHLLSASGLRKLAKIPGFDKGAIRRLLKQKARGTVPTYLSELRGISDHGAVTPMDERYVVWEYHGPIDFEDMDYVARYTQDEDLQKYAGDIDPLQEINVTIWFCQDELLKFGIHHLDSGEPIYSVFNYKKDDHSIFGFGVPHLMENHQEVICASWRMMVDNAVAATLPQIIINTSIVEPYDGDYTIYPGKIWRKKSGTAPGDKVFETFHMDIRQAEMRAIIDMTLQAIDRQIGVPRIADAESPIAPMQTALGVSVFSNERKMIFKGLVKNFDDNVTIPNMRRLFSWNMQFNPNPSIKGDMRIKARGTSTFLLRELQGPALMAMLVQFASHPILGPALKIMPMVRKVAQAMLLPMGEVVKTDEQMAADLAAAAQAAPDEPSPEQIKLQVAQLNHDAAVQQAQINAESRKYEVDKQYEIELLRQEMVGNKNLDALEAKKEIERAKIESGERKMAADIGMAERTGRGSGGYV